MPPAEEIQRRLAGAWRMMNGKEDGLRLLDLSADGFWNSFFAIVVALPALVVGWVTIAGELQAHSAEFGNRTFTLMRLALVDLGTWILPLCLLALAARPAGIAGRFVHYVVASNWATAIFAWIMLPPALIRLLWRDAGDAAAAISFVLFLGTLVLSWRLTNVAIDRGAGVATAVFFGMLTASVVVLFGLQALLGVAPPPQ